MYTPNESCGNGKKGDDCQKDAWVEVGRHNLQANIANEPGAARYGMEYWLVHPGYDDSEFYNDIALIKLKTPVVNAEPIRLDKPVNEGGVAQEETMGFVTGWGSVDVDCNQYQPKCMDGPAYIPTDNECGRELGRSWYDENVHICGGFDRQYTEAGCGDSGGPLVVLDSSNNNEPVQVGVVSWGYGGTYTA